MTLTELETRDVLACRIGRLGLLDGLRDRYSFAEIEALLDFVLWQLTLCNREWTDGELCDYFSKTVK